MAITNLGPYNWSASRDDEGHREYRIFHKIGTDAPFKWSGAAYAGDGPESISGASGLPAVGDVWSYGNDSDAWAICVPSRVIRPFDAKDGEAIQVYSVESTFSTKPLNRCSTDEIGDPLLEPQKVRGGSVRYTIEAIKDRYGEAIMSSSHEMFRGPQVEFDGGRDQVIVEQNVADLELSLCTSLRNKLNDDVLWGLADRRIKLSDFYWEELWYGSCTYYYRRTFIFDIRNDPDDLFDRKILDEGTKVINGRWDNGAWVRVPYDGYGGSNNPDPDNPSHFIRFKDKNGENIRAMLDGNGMPATSQQVYLGTTPDVPGTGTGTSAGGDAYYIPVEYYDEADLTQLNIPTSLDFGTAAS